MPDFNQAHKFVARWEGLYSNDPLDPGGETLHGITRRDFPDWPGWEIWDRDKKDGPEIIAHRDALYQSQFWTPLRAQEYPTRRLAIIVYQAAVNCGVRRVSRWLQSTLNTVAGADLMVDGRIGEATIRALRKAFEDGFIKIVEDTVLNHQQRHYTSLVDRNPKLGRFLRGWMNRIRAAEKL